MRSIASLVAIAAAITLLAAGTAGAHSKTFATEVDITTISVAPGPTVSAYGLLTGNRRCTGARPLKLLLRSVGGPARVVDEGRTSRNGHYGLSGAAEGTLDRVIVRAPKRRVGPIGKRHRHICAMSQKVLVAL